VPADPLSLRDSVLLEHPPPHAPHGPLLSPLELAELTGYSERRIRQLAAAAAAGTATIGPDGAGGWVTGRRDPFPLLFAAGRLLLDPQGRDAFAVATAPRPFLTEAAPTAKRGRPATTRGAQGWRFQRCPLSAVVIEWVEVPQWWPEESSRGRRFRIPASHPAAT